MWDIHKANAAFIVHCVNNHERLVEVCKVLVNQMTNLAYMFDLPVRFKESYNAGINQAKQALQSAEEL